jgi:hypothetical protein
MAAAIKPFAKDLFSLEETQADYDDLVDFFCAFFHEWAVHHPEFLPSAKADERHALRRRSFALSNIMFFPLFRLAWDLWHGHHEAKDDWRNANDWKDALARLAGTVPVELEDGTTVDVDVMARDEWVRKDDDWVLVGHGNPAWQGKILIEKFGSDGQSKGWSLSSTRQTREAAYQYVRSVAFPTD